MFRVGIEKAANHALVLGVVLCRFSLEKFHAAFAQSKRDLRAFITKNEILGRRKEVHDHFWLTHWLIGVFYFRAHKCVFPFSSSQRPKCE